MERGAGSGASERTAAPQPPAVCRVKTEPGREEEPAKEHFRYPPEELADATGLSELEAEYLSTESQGISHVERWFTAYFPAETTTAAEEVAAVTVASEELPAPEGVGTEVPASISLQLPHSDPAPRVSDTDRQTGEPGPSGVQRHRLTIESHLLAGHNSGSELDSEYDDEFDPPDRFAPEGRELPPDEELNEEAAAIMMQADIVIDEAQCALPGVNIDFVWSEDFGDYNGRRETFTGGPVGPTMHHETPYDAFIAIWDEGIMRLIADETNAYAWLSIVKMVEGDTLTESSRLNEWMETDVDELYVLFALFIAMGISPRLRQDDYWSTCEMYSTPGFIKVMSFNRYVLLNKFLHFVDNNVIVSQSEKKLFKLMPIIDHCNAKFQQHYVLPEHIAIDESLTSWKKRLSWVQCIRSKSARFGIKSFELCDSKTGYLWRFVIYTGKDTGQPSSASVHELAGKSTAIVLELLKGLEFKGYYLTMDNFYNSPILARYLKSLGFDCVGTLRVSRKHVPDAIKLKKSVRKGTIEARHCGDVAVLSWKDSKVVSTISTFHTAETYSGTRAGKQLTKPLVIRDYNAYMGGVDLKDQKLAMYLMERKRGVKWYMKMFKRLLNVSVHNAYVLHRASAEARSIKLLTHRQFRDSVVADLLSKHCKGTSRIRSEHVPPFAPAGISGEIRLRTDVMHVPKCVSNRDRRRCARCLSYGRSLPQYKSIKVPTMCATCNKALCFEGCWVDYHSMPDLSIVRQ